MEERETFSSTQVTGRDVVQDAYCWLSHACSIDELGYVREESFFSRRQACCAVGKIVVAIWFQQGCKTQSDGVCGFHNCSVPLD